MALVVCDKHDRCGHLACPWHEPRQEVEIGFAHCKHWAIENGSTSGVNNIRIMAVAATYPAADKNNPNTAFKRKKYGF